MNRPDHILIVDDDADIRELLGEYLQKHGLKVSTAADGRQMRAVLAAAQIDLIVLDLMLPPKTGSRCAATCARTRRIRCRS
jgi:two-component system OmpR family response regulator